ncbi:2964_t:CDS:2, partial [Dentiscutata erythropus]
IIDILNQEERIKIRDYIDSTNSQRQSATEKKLNALIDKIKNLPNQQIIRIEHIVNTMIYPQGNMKGQILSPYLQNKAIEFVSSGFFKHYSSAFNLQNKIKKLESKNKVLTKSVEQLNKKLRSFCVKIVQAEKRKQQYIFKIRSVAQKSKKIKKNQFQIAAKKMIKRNNNEYTTKFVKLATEISNIRTISLLATIECAKAIAIFFTGEIPKHWLSTETLSRWNKEVARISLNQNRPENPNLPAYSYGVMADKSTRGDKKVFLVCFAYWNEHNQLMITLAKMIDLNKCSGAIIAKTVKETCEENKLDPALCGFWLTDNTAYMSGNKLGAIVEFNLQANASSGKRWEDLGNQQLCNGV